jgi:hypothetical protein
MWKRYYNYVTALKLGCCNGRKWVLMIIYKPTPPCDISIGESILRTEIQGFFEVLYPMFLKAKPYLDLVTSENELWEVLDSVVDQVAQRPVVCFCFPHELPKNVSSELYLALPTFFEVVSDSEEYSLPVEMWVENIKELDGVIVPSPSLKNLVLAMTSSEVPVYQVSTFLANAEKNELDFHGTVNEKRVLIPCRSFINTNDGPWYGEENPPATAIKRFGSNDRTGEIYSCDLGGIGAGDIWPIGFYPAETWGAWAESRMASLVIPMSVCGRIQTSVSILAIGKNIGREIEVRIGDSSQKIRLKESLNTYILDFDIATPVNQIFFFGYAIDTEVDSRGLGIGISAFKIAKRRSILSKVMHRLSRKRASIGNATTLDAELEQLAHSDLTLELSGRIYLMELRAIDLMFDNWTEILKVYSLALENNKDVNLLIVCPSNLVKFVFPFATQFFNRIDPRSTLIHFVFIDDFSQSLDSLQKYQDLILVRRADGKEFDTYLEQYERQWVTIGPQYDDSDTDVLRGTTYPVSVRRQIRNMLYGEFLPVVLTSDYDNEQLLQAFVESSRYDLINTNSMKTNRRRWSHLSNANTKNIAALFNEKEVQ